MTNYEQELFGPLRDSGYCNYFYYLSVFGMIFFLFSLYYVLTRRKTARPFHIFILLMQPLLFYFVNRLHYSICLNSLK